MTAQQMTAAMERALAEHITIAASGRIKATGDRFFLVNGSHGGSQYTVLVHADRLACRCPAGQNGTVCKHRAVVHQRLVAERMMVQASVTAARPETVRPHHETALLFRSTAPVSIWT